MSNGNDWSHDQTYDEYVDFSKEVASFKDEINSSVDLKLCFDMEQRTAYMTVVSHNDDGDTKELNDTEIKLTWEEGKRQLGEELGKFLENQVAVFRGLKIDPDSPLYRAMQGTVFAVEANTFEQRILYGAYKDEVRWVGDNSGYLPTIGHIDDRPVCVSLFWVEIDGKRVLFYHPTSQAVDHKLIEEWLDANMPLNEYNGRKTRCDADNFHMCVGAVREMNANG